MNKIKNLTAKRVEEIGGKAAPQLDFSDDGANFKSYVIEGIPVSTTRSCGSTYLTFDPDSINSAAEKGLSDLTFTVPFDLWKETRAYQKLEDKYNGVPEFDFDEFLEDAKAFREGVISAQKEFEAMEIPENNLSTKLRAEATVGRAFIEGWKQKFDWFNASDFEIKRLRDYAKSFLNYCTRADELASEIDSKEISKKDLYELSNRSKKFDYIVVDLKGFYFEELEKSTQKAA